MRPLIHLSSFYDVHFPVGLASSFVIYGMFCYRRASRQITPLSQQLIN